MLKLKLCLSITLLLLIHVGKSSPKPIKTEDDDVIEAGSPQENEFVSDTFQEEGHISDEDLKKEMQMLGMEELKKDEG